MLFTPEIPKEEPQKSPYSRRPGFRSLEEAKGQVSKEELLDGLDNAAEWMVPFYDAGTNMTNVISEYSKPEDERNYEYIKEELNKAGTSAGTEANMYLMGGIVAKYGAKGLQALGKMRKAKKAKKGYAAGGKVVKELVERYGKDLVDDVIEMISVFLNHNVWEGDNIKRWDTESSYSEVVSGRNASQGRISISPEGKPSFKVSNDNVESVGTEGKGNTLIKTNLFKKKAGWKWKNAPEGYENAGTLISVENRGKHYYTIDTDFTKGVNLKKYADSPSEPRLRPTVKGQIERATGWNKKRKRKRTSCVRKH